jgi:hypothetical protein
MQFSVLGHDQRSFQHPTSFVPGVHRRFCGGYDDSMSPRMPSGKPLRWRGIVALAVAVGMALSLGACTAYGWGAQPTPTASRGVPFGTDYSSGRCPSSSATSKALGVDIDLKSAKLHGYEFDCSYSNGSGETAEVSYNSSAHASVRGVEHQLDGLFGKSNLTYIPNLGSGTWIVKSASGAISVLALAHGYSISVVTNGGTASGEARLERIAVDDWTH